MPDRHDLLESIGMAAVFLDLSLNIRSFTTAASGIFNLAGSDAGRPLSDIAHHLDYAELGSDLDAVRADGVKRERQVRRTDGEVYLMRVLPCRSEAGHLTGLVVTFVDVTSFKRAEVRQQQLITELNHRVKNVLGVLTSLALQTLGEDARRPPFKSFIDRVQALSRSYELVTGANWTEVSLRDVVSRELMPHVVGEHRIKVDGPDVMLSARLTLALSMVLHELATNAVKYGALSVACGGLDVTWDTLEDGGSRILVLSWRECDGPPVSVPERRGLGRTLIENQLEYEFGGTSVMDFRADGLRASIRVPLEASR